MALVEPIKIEGFAEFNRNLRTISADLPKGLRLANNETAQLVVDWARPRVPKDSGRAAGTIKAKSTRTEVRVQGGSKAAPYYPWLDFGGRVGRNKATRRQFYGGGRYLYPGLDANRSELEERHVAALVDLVRRAGLDVTT
jgi:hypothetical protein